MSERWTPAKYQKAGVRWLVKHPEAALFWDPGLRKTSVALAAFCAMQKAGGSRKVLIIAPRRVCYLVWAHVGEVGKWEDFKHLQVALLHGKDKDDAVEEDADLYVINPGGLSWLLSGHCAKCGKDRPKIVKSKTACCVASVKDLGWRLQSLLKRGVDHLIVDELSQFKDTRTQRFKLLKKWMPRFRRRWGLTGSPASNGLIDLFGQVYLLDLGTALGRYVTHYRHAYFVPSGYGGHDWKLQDGAEKKIYRRLKPLVDSRRASDHLDLPPLVEEEVWVNLPKKARQAYDELEKLLITSLDAGVVTAANAAVASGKCRQVASGGVYREVETERAGLPELQREAVQLHDEKTEALGEIVDELQGQPVLVLYEFHHDLDRLRGLFGPKVPVLNGQTKDKALPKIVSDWNAGKLPVLCGHPAAMGHGLNLQGCGSHIVWYSLTWSLELYDQAIRRLYRSGQKRRVVVHRLLARDTVDEVIMKVLRGKRRGQSALMDALRRYVHQK